MESYVKDVRDTRYEPSNSRIHSHDGIFHNFTTPVHDPVRRKDEVNREGRRLSSVIGCSGRFDGMKTGEKLHAEIERESPLWLARAVYFFTYRNFWRFILLICEKYSLSLNRFNRFWMSVRNFALKKICIEKKNGTYTWVMNQQRYYALLLVIPSSQMRWM